MFKNSSVGFFLLITHILACVTVGIIFRFWKYNSNSNNSLKKSHYASNKNISFSDLGEIISDSVYKATSTIMMVGGFVVLFSVIVSIFKASHLQSIVSYAFLPFFEVLHISPTFIEPLLAGILEITNGIAQISIIQLDNLSLKLIFTSFLLGIGGISIFLQVFSIVSKTDLSIKPYIYGKILHGIISAFYTFLFIKFGYFAL